MFTVNTGAIYRQFFGAILVLGLVLSYTDYYQENRAEAIEVVGKTIIELEFEKKKTIFLKFVSFQVTYAVR